MATAKKATANRQEYYISGENGYIEGPYSSLEDLKEDVKSEGWDIFSVYIKQGTYEVEHTTTIKEIK